MKADERAEHMPAEAPGRRGLLLWGIGVIAVAATGILTWPLVASLVGPMYRRIKRGMNKVTEVDALPEGEPKEVGFHYLNEDAYMREQTVHKVWVIKQSATSVTVFSPICPHLGCRYDWHPALKRFICPCHGSVFSIAGRVLAGPAPRPLDTLPHKIEDGDLLVEWERFEVGIPQKAPV